MPPPLPAKELGHALGGHPAKVTLGVYLDYVCPYSKKQYMTLRKVVTPHYRDRGLRWIFHHQVQPWHPQSTLTHEAALAVAKVGNEDAFWKFSDALYERQEDFFDLNVQDKTRTQITAELAALAASTAGVPREAVAEQLALAKIEGEKNPGSNISQELKWAVKHARQLGIHVSPTCTLNGLLVDTSSGWGLDEWRGLLDPLLA